MRRSEAKAWAARTEAAMREGRRPPVVTAGRHTIGELIDRYLTGLARRRPHALAKDGQRLAWWKKRLGGHGIESVTPALIAAARDELLSENIGSARAPRRRSPATANRYLAVLSMAMGEAVRAWRWLPANPLRGVARKPELPRRARDLSGEERAQLFEACKRSTLPQLELIVRLALTTGMRRGEILGLRWPDVNLRNGSLVLAVTRNGERRSVPLAPEVAQALLAQSKLRRRDTDRVFPGRSADRPPAIDKAFRAALAAARIRNFRFHDLRQAAARDLAKSGAAPEEIAVVLGYKTLALARRHARLDDAKHGDRA